MARTSLPPGFRFHPTDVELVMFYLKRKVMGKQFRFDAIADLNIYKYSPMDLPDKSCLRSKDLEWFFFCPKEKKYASGARTNRATEIGYWKSTGKDRSVSYDGQIVGMVKTLVFHIGHAPKGERTDWVMHEYRIQQRELADAGVIQDAYVLCKVFQKNGPGPKNGAQYGAPFKEEDWPDDDETVTVSLPSNSLAPPALPCNKNDSAITSTFVPGSTSSGPLSEPGPSFILPSAGDVRHVPLPVPDEQDINSLMDIFTEDSFLLPDHVCNNQEMNFSHENNSEGLACPEEIFNGLEDLHNLAEPGGGGFKFSSHQPIDYGWNPALASNNVPFLELNDLNCPLNSAAGATGSNQILIDSFCQPSYNSIYLEQSDSFGTVQHNNTMNTMPVLAEGSNVHGDCFNVFQAQGNCIRESANLGFTNTCSNVNFTPFQQPEVETIHAVQDQNRGDQQKKSFSRLQQLLESIPARPASAAEHLAPANGAEIFKESSIFSAYGCSSIHVKAEVTRWGGGCTEDALSEKLGDSPSGCCRCNLPWTGFGLNSVRRRNGFAIFFFLGMFSTLILVLLVAAMFSKLGWYVWNFVIS